MLPRHAGSSSSRIYYGWGVQHRMQREVNKASTDFLLLYGTKVDKISNHLPEEPLNRMQDILTNIV